MTCTVYIYIIYICMFYSLGILMLDFFLEISIIATYFLICLLTSKFKRRQGDHWSPMYNVHTYVLLLLPSTQLEARSRSRSLREKLPLHLKVLLLIICFPFATIAQI